MTVTAEYAQRHLRELLAATDRGEQIEIERPDKPAVRLILSAPRPASTDRRGMFGWAKGKVWMADDWDSDEVNEAIARFTNEGPIFPNE